LYLLTIHTEIQSVTCVLYFYCVS